jgi:PAS domain S-box-containing protein
MRRSLGSGQKIMAEEDELRTLREELRQTKERNSDLEQQVKMRESERDLLAVMLNEAETSQKRWSDWFDHACGEFEDNRRSFRPRGDYDLSSAIKVGIIVLTDSGRIEATNRWMKQLTGYSRLELVGKNLALLFSEDDGQQNVMEKLMDVGTQRMIETDLIRKTGEKLVVAVMINARKADRILMAIIDLTNMQRVQLDS